MSDAPTEDIVPSIGNDEKTSDNAQEAVAADMTEQKDATNGTDLITSPAALAAAEYQTLTNMVLSDAQTKLAEISAVAAQAAQTRESITKDQAAITTSVQAAATMLAEFQVSTASALADIQRQISEVSTIAAQAAIAKAAATATAESQSQLNSALNEAKSKLNEITSAAERVATAKTIAAEEQTAITASAKTAAAAFSESQTLIAAVLADSQAKLVDISAAATQAAAAKTQITDLQSVVATKSVHIQDAQVHADKVRADLDRALTAATQQVTAAEAEKSNAQSAAEAVAKLLADIQTFKGSVEVEATTIANSRKTSEQSTAVTKSLADKAVTVESRIKVYEKRIAELDAQCVDLLDRSEKILLGSTAVGLAHAFDARRQTFTNPRDQWQKVFVGSVILIVMLAATGLWQVYHTTGAPSYDELVRMWLSRLPVGGALVWLALHASHEAALAKRLEEDYAYKSAISACFEGFRKQMSDIGKDGDSNSALSKLCVDTLTTIASPPGRIYDSHKLTVSPIDEIRQLARTATDAAKASSEAAKTTVEAAKPVVEAVAKAASPLS